MYTTKYRLVSRSGEYSGPCPFYDRGDDRFAFWPNASPANWYCRKACDDCPGRETTDGGRWGQLEDVPELADMQVEDQQAYPPPDMQAVQRYVEQRSLKTLRYLAERGITDLRVCDRFYLGEQAGRRLTIPLITHAGDIQCHGIKKRWLGEPPAFIAKYLMDPGSTAKGLFHIDVLLNGLVNYCLIVESQLDVILLAQIGIPAVAPFGGGACWSQDWLQYFRNVEEAVTVVADIDQPDQQGKRAGTAYAQHQAQTFSEAYIVYPPYGGTDLTDAHCLGCAITEWTHYIRQAALV